MRDTCANREEGRERSSFINLFFNNVVEEKGRRKENRKNQNKTKQN